MKDKRPLSPKRENALAPICHKLQAQGFVPGFFGDGKDRPGKGWPTRPFNPKAGGSTVCLRMQENKGLGGYDVDITHQALNERALQLTYDRLPVLAAVPHRHSGGAKVMLFCRCATAEGRRLVSGSWYHGDDPEKETQKIEFFTSNDPRYVCTHGKHSEGRSYGWKDGRALEDVAFADLPEVEYGQISDLLSAFDKLAESLGFIRKAAKKLSRAEPIYDLRPEQEVVLADGTRMTLEELAAIAPGHGDWLRCFATPWDPGSETADRVKANIGPYGLEMWDCREEEMHYFESARPADMEEVAALLRKVRDNVAGGQTMFGAQPLGTEMPAPPAKDDPSFQKRVQWLLQTHGYCGPDHKVIELYLAEDRCMLEPAAFRLLFAPWHTFGAPKKNGNPGKLMEATERWERHPDRISVRGARLRPDQPFPLYEENNMKFKNTYRRPVHEGSGDIAVWRRFIEHLLPDRIEREWFLNWLAHKWIHPGVPGVAVIMVACDGNGPVYGTGRGFLRDIVARLVGRKYVEPIDFDVLNGASSQSQFTAWGAYALIVTVSESKDTAESGRWADRRATYERLKELVEPRAVERAFQVKKEKAFRGICFASYMIFSNNRDALQIPKGDRRFVALANGMRMSAAMAQELTAWMEVPGNIAALATELEARDLSGFDVFTPLDTQTKTTMQELAVSDLDEWFIATRKVITRKTVFTAADALGVMLVEAGTDATDDVRRMIKRKIRNESRSVGGDWRMPAGLSEGRARILVWRDYDGPQYATVEDAQGAVMARRRVATGKAATAEEERAAGLRAAFQTIPGGKATSNDEIKLRPQVDGTRPPKPSLR